MEEKTKKYNDGVKEGTRIVDELKTLENEKGKPNYLDMARKDVDLCLMF